MPSLYNIFMTPLERMGIRKARKVLIKRAHGAVLELGAGTGANLPFYDYTKLNRLVVTDQNRSKHLDDTYHDVVEFVEADAIALPFENHTFDVVVHTLLFCSVADVNQGLQEIKRVLKQHGTLIFIEHVMPEKKRMQSIFRRINPLWRKISQGCSLTKDFSSSLQENGFFVTHHGKFLNTVFYYGIASQSRE